MNTVENFVNEIVNEIEKRTFKPDGQNYSSTQSPLQRLDGKYIHRIDYPVYNLSESVDREKNAREVVNKWTRYFNNDTTYRDKSALTANCEIPVTDDFQGIGSYIYRRLSKNGINFTVHVWWDTKQMQETCSVVIVTDKK